MIGLPKCSGQIESEKDVLNNYWVSTGSDDDKTAGENREIAQVSDVVQNSEDQGNELDVMITQNKNVYRLLRMNGPKAAGFSIIVAQELEYIFPKAGYFVQTLLEKCPNSIYPIVLRKLRERYISLFKQKFETITKISQVLENQLPILRSQYTKPPKIGAQSNPIWVSKIEYDQLSVPMFANFILESMKNEHKYTDAMKSAVDKLVSQLRTPNHYILSYSHAISLLFFAHFMNEVKGIHIVDELESKSVRTAIEIGVTKKNLHGMERILSLISKIFTGQRKSEAMHHIAGLMSNVSTNEAARIASIGYSLVNLIYSFANENNSVSFVKLDVAGNTISLSPIDQNRVSIDINEAKYNNKFLKW